MVADQTEQRGRIGAGQTAKPHTSETSCGDIIVPNTPPAGEYHGGINITLAIRTPERLQGSPELIPTLTCEPQGTPEAQVEPPAWTAPTRIEQGRGAACLIRYTGTASTSYN